MKIVLGGAKTGKSAYLYGEIKKEIEKNAEENLILIVPDLMTYQSEYDIISRLDIEGFMNLEVLSFKRLEEKILDEIGKTNKQEIGSLGKMMILNQVFQENSDDFQTFKKVVNKEGLLKEFNLIIKELKENDISPDLLEDTIKKMDNSLLKGKLADINLIYSKYIDSTKDSFLDEEDKTNLIISMIEKSNYISNAKIWIDGFESFNPQRIKLIKSLLDRSKDLTISLNIDLNYTKDLESFYDFEVFKTIYDTYKSLEGLGEDIQIVALKEDYISTKEINILKNNIFSLNQNQYNQPIENIEIYSSMNPYTEVERTAYKIMSLVRDKDYRWKDIKIAVTDMESYITNIGKVFDKFEIPYFLDIKRDMRKNPVTRYILSILDIFIWNFRYEDVFEYLKTGFSSLDVEEVNLLENYALQYGVENYKWFKHMGQSDNKIEDIKDKFLADFKEQIDRFKELTSIREITEFLFDYLKLHDINRKVHVKIEGFKRDGKYEESSEYLQIWNALMEIFQQILYLGEDTIITALEYRKILESAFEETKISLIPPTIDKVEIGNIDRIAVNKSKVLFILGSNEGSFETNREKGLLLDEERNYLHKYNIRLLNSSNFFYFKDKHMVYKLFVSPSDKLFISYSYGTTDGKSMEPSLYIHTLKEIFPQIGEETDISMEDGMNFVSNEKPTYDKLIENIRKYADGKDMDPLWNEVYLWYKNNNKDKLESIKRGLNYRAESSKINPAYIDKLFKSNNYMTVSKLERFAGCQFRYFVENILSPNDRTIEKIEVYDLGNIYHDVLEDFIDQIIYKDNLNNLTEEEIYNIIKNCVDKAFAYIGNKNTAFDSNNRNKYLKNKTLRLLRRTGITIVKQLKAGEFRPKYTELQIGNFNNYNEKIKRGIYIDPLIIENQNYSLKLRGKIDRVDILKDKEDLYINVIDYKSSSKDLDFTEIYEGLNIQLLVYLYALVENGEKLLATRPKIGGIFYYHINDPIIKIETDSIEDEIFRALKLKGFVLEDKDIVEKIDKNIGTSSNIIPVRIKNDGDFYSDAKVLTEEEFEDLLYFAKDKVNELSEEILKGEFLINPFKKKDLTPCKYCDYISICQFDEGLGNKYRGIKDIKKSEFFNEVLKKGVSTSAVD